uniref:Protein sel-1 1-like n=1 Tax=Tetraselmis sp. GSL018 TaxID=582737 RepID=A0A061SHG4_9CHLO
MSSTSEKAPVVSRLALVVLFVATPLQLALSEATLGSGSNAVGTTDVVNVSDARQPFTVGGFDGEEELRNAAAAAMKAIKSREAIAERERAQRRAAEWEASLGSAVDEYLRTVAETGAAPEGSGDEREEEPPAAAAPAAGSGEETQPGGASEGREAAGAQPGDASEGREAAGARPAAGDEGEAEEGEADDGGPSANAPGVGELEQQLFLDASVRDVASSVAQLASMAQALAAAIPETPSKRRRLRAGLHEGEDGGEGGPSPRPPPLPEAILKAQAQAMLNHSKSIEWGGTVDPALRKMADAGSAAFILAALAASGIAARHEPLNDTRAVELLHQSAMAGSVEAHTALADRYFLGRGVPQDCPWGLHHAKVAATHAIQVAEDTSNYIAPLPTVRLRDRWLDPNYVDAYQQENGEAQVEMEEDMARRGSAEAQRHLGFRRLLGHGMEANPEHAMREFEGAAAEGDPYAMFNIGYMYLRGLGAAQDFPRAMQWFRRAADAGLPAAANGLGVMHFNGQGVPQNLTEARRAFEKGAEGGDADSMYNLGTIYRSGFGTPVNATLSKKYFQDAYKAGHWRGRATASP